MKDVIAELREEAYPTPAKPNQVNIIISRLALLWAGIADARLRAAYIILVLRTMEAQYRRVAAFDEGQFQDMLRTVSSCIAFRCVSGKWPEEGL